MAMSVHLLALFVPCSLTPVRFFIPLREGHDGCTGPRTVHHRSATPRWSGPYRRFSSVGAEPAARSAATTLSPPGNAGGGCLHDGRNADIPQFIIEKTRISR